MMEAEEGEMYSIGLLLENGADVDIVDKVIAFTLVLDVHFTMSLLFDYAYMRRIIFIISSYSAAWLYGFDGGLRNGLCRRGHDSSRGKRRCQYSEQGDNMSNITFINCKCYQFKKKCFATAWTDGPFGCGGRV